MYKEVEGDLISLAREGEFDVIAHGCNCQCIMGAGIAPLMAKAFGCDEFTMEELHFKSDVNKLGTIDYENVYLDKRNGDLISAEKHSDYEDDDILELIVVNAYTQFDIGRNTLQGGRVALDYEALKLCLRKMNHEFKGEKIGLPLIGAGLAGGDAEQIKQIISTELCDCEVTLVLFNPKKNGN